MDKLILHPRTETNVQRSKGKLPHALIVEGPSGVGVRALAETLAASMESPKFIIEPKKIINGQPAVDHKEGNIIIDDIRLLYEQTRSKQPGNHVYIFDTGERTMTVPAQNAFLKLLEEPRKGLYFIIATHHVDQLLPTITSRSQQLSVLPVTAEQTKQMIAAFPLSDPIKKARLAFVGQGLPALLRRLVDDVKLYEARVAIMSDAKVLIGGNNYEKSTVIHKYRENRADAVTLLDDINHQLSVVIKNTPDPAIASLIAKNLSARQNILTGGNIRLQLLSSVI